MYLGQDCHSCLSFGELFSETASQLEQVINEPAEMAGNAVSSPTPWITVDREFLIWGSQLERELEDSSTSKQPMAVPEASRSLLYSLALPTGQDSESDLNNDDEFGNADDSWLEHAVAEEARLASEFETASGSRSRRNEE
jgi:hypothetical protein